MQIFVSDCVNFCAAGLRSRTALAAENLFLRKQLALFQEREKKAAPTRAADRFVLSRLARLFAWRSALLIVKPATLIGWHRAAFRRFWRLKSRPLGRPSMSAEVRRLIRRMATENLTWAKSGLQTNFGSNCRFESHHVRLESISSKRHDLMAVRISAGRHSSGTTQMEWSLATSSFQLR